MWRGGVFLDSVGFVSFVFLWLGIRVFATRTRFPAALHSGLQQLGELWILPGAFCDKLFQEIFFI